MKISNKKIWLYLIVVAVVCTIGLKAILPESIVSNSNGTMDHLHLYFILIVGYTLFTTVSHIVVNKTVVSDQYLVHKFDVSEKDTKKNFLYIAVLGAVALTVSYSGLIAGVIALISLITMVLYKMNYKAQAGLYKGYLVYKGKAYNLDNTTVFKKSQDGFRFEFVEKVLFFKVSHIVEFKLITNTDEFTADFKSLTGDRLAA